MANHFSTPFGIGFLSLIPEVTIANPTPTPVRIAVIKDVSVKTSVDFEELYGEEIDPLDAADKSRSTEITCKASGYNGLVLSASMGVTATTGHVLSAKDESHTVPAVSGPYTVAATGTVAVDCGVVDSTSGIVMTRSSSASAAGIYSLSGSTYTFNAADTTHVVLLSYLKTANGGYTIAVGGELAGAAPKYRLDLFRNYSSNSLGFSFPAVKFGGLTHSQGNQKHGEIDISFKAYKDPTTGLVVTIYSNK